MNSFYRPQLLLAFLLIILFSCADDKQGVKVLPNKITDISAPLFQEIAAAKSGIHFKNMVAETMQNNFMNNNLLYSGGGTAIGDLNDDGLQDLIFISNTGLPGVYINKGDFGFEKLGVESGIKQMLGWSSGVTIVDVNGDSKQDIYICRGGSTERNDQNRQNLLYINKGNLKFVEQAAAYGLNDVGVSTQAAFFDYDLDGDLDVYVLNYLPGVQQIPFGELKSRRTNPSDDLIPIFSDHLYRNDGSIFTDVSKASGITNWGHGLGIGISDINQDGFPDIFIANDFDVDDFYYENNGNGTFTEKLKEHFGHVSFFAMGVDIADINNDGYLDVFEVEMLPKDRKRAIRNMQSMNRGRFEDLLKIDFAPQYMRNSLHLNRGNGYFTDIAQIAGVAKTDWSWGALLLDLNDDGLKDIYVTNGILRDMKDRDFQKNGNALAAKTGGKLTLQEMNNIVPSVKIRNYAYRNNGNYSFTDVSDEWGFDFKGFSNGTSYGDLDNDGDLDLIVNNLNEVPVVYKNTSADRGVNNLNLTFEGPKGNIKGIGAKVRIETTEGIQYQELYLSRGFQSASEARLHFGLGKLKSVAKVEVTWPDGKQELFKDVPANNILRVKYNNAKTILKSKTPVNKMFADISRSSGINFKHKETYFDDYRKEILIPHKMSQNGPFLTVGDCNGDGFEDVYVGGARGQSGQIYLQNADGSFTGANNGAIAKDAVFEDMGALFFDADNDKDLDLYVVSGSNEFEKSVEMYQDRLYINDGKANFSRSNGLPKMTASGSCVKASDYDGDGDLDLFVGGRLIPQQYPKNPESYLLQNNGGKFTDVTLDVAKDLRNVGMVTSAVWTDYDQDKDLDLIVVGEWMPIIIFENNKGKFAKKESGGLDNTDGWWSRIEAIDLDNDGDEDLVVGNIGLNHKFKADEDKPLHVYCDDFDNTGSLDIVLAFQSDEKLVPVRGRDCSSEQMPFITDKFPSFEEFSDAGVKDILGAKIDKALHKEAKLFSSMVYINNGGSFVAKALPLEAQLSSINGIIAEDFDNDGRVDLLIAGNLFETEAETSRADGNIGLLLKGKGDGNFEPIGVNESGFFVPGDVKDIGMIKQANGSKVILVANNNGPLQTFQTTNLEALN